MVYVFLNVLNMNITASVIIIAVILIRALIRKLPKKFSYILWIIPAVRLICPVSVSASFSVFNLFSPQVEQNRMEYIPKNHTAVPAEQPFLLPPASSEVRNTAGIYSEHTDNNVSVTDIFVFIWFAVTVIILAYFIISYIAVHRRVKYSRKKQGYYVCAGIDTPFIFGLFRPKIYVPENLSDSDLECVLAHENAHISRYDHILKIICVLIAAVHWFNPLVWIACRLMALDMEFSCDEKALGNMKGKMKKTYAASLLNISMKQNKISLTGIICFGEINIKRRIKYVLAIKKPDVTSVIFAVIVITAASVTMLTNAETKIFKVTSELLSTDNNKDSIPDNQNSNTAVIITTAKTEILDTSIVSSVNIIGSPVISSAIQETSEPKRTETENHTTVKPEEKPIYVNDSFADHTADEFKSILYNGICYSAFYDHGSHGYLKLHSIPEAEVGKKLYDGTINITEYSKGETASDDCKPNGSIYSMKDITDDFSIAVKYEDTDNYYLYTNTSYYSAAIGDFINDFSLRETLCPEPGLKYSAQHSYRNINDKGYYDIITEYYDIDVDFVIDMLIDNANAPFGSSDYVRLESPDYSIYCFIPSLNTHISFGIYEKCGYISAGAGEFYIGEEKAGKIIGKIQSEYPCCETLIDDGVTKQMVIGKYEP